MIPSKVLAVCLIAVLLAPVAILAQNPNTDGEEVLARIHFDPKTYELYRPWAEKWFEELGKPRAPHQNPSVNGFGLSTQYGNVPVEWVRAILSTQAVQSDDGSEYILTVRYAAGVRRDVCSEYLETLVLNTFFENNGFAADQWRARKEEVDQQIKEIVKARNDLADEQRELTQKLERDRRAISDETLQQQIAAIEEGPKLELEMNLAETEARRTAIMEKSAEARDAALSFFELQRKGSLLSEELRQQQLELERLKNVKADLSSEELERMQANIDELVRTIESNQLTQRLDVPGDLRQSLKEMLAQAEIDYAGFEARRKVLFDQYASLKERLEQRVEIQNHIDELESRRDELSDEMNALSNELNSDEYRTPRPVIEWVPQPE